MNEHLKAWARQGTTAHGTMILGSTLLGLMTGTVSWEVGLPLLAAGIVGLIWPENPSMQAAARTMATDVEALIAAYRVGLGHAAPDAKAAPPAPKVMPSAPEAAPPASSATTGLALLAVSALALGACADQTEAQRIASVQAVAAGLVCVADAGGGVVAVAGGVDPDAVKAAKAAAAAGGALAGDAACQQAISRGAAAIPVGATRSARDLVTP